MRRAYTGDRREERDERKAQERAEQAEQEALRIVLDSVAGRRVLMRVLDYLQPRDVQMWQPNAQIQVNAVRHDVGDWLKRQIDAADPAGLDRMMHEAHVREREQRRAHVEVKRDGEEDEGDEKEDEAALP